MDLSTFIGLVAGCIIISVSILLGGSFMLYVDVPSILIVFGGMLCSTLISYPLSDVLGVIRTVGKAFFLKEVPVESIIETLVNYATIARREGILALEGQTGKAGDEFLVRSVQMAIDGTSPELIKDILSTELAFTEERHGVGHGVVGALGTFAPAFGMIGTLIGLVAMLANLSDPSSLGAGMAVALITTLYGAVLSNLVLLPIQGKLKVRTQREMLIKLIIIEGILSIQSGDNPRVVEQKLKSFISPAQRAGLNIGK